MTHQHQLEEREAGVRLCVEPGCDVHQVPCVECMRRYGIHEWSEPDSTLCGYHLETITYCGA